MAVGATGVIGAAGMTGRGMRRTKVGAVETKDVLSAMIVTGVAVEGELHAQ